MSCNGCTSFSPQYTPPGGSGGSLPIDCTGVIMSSFTPSCFTPASPNLCGYMSGIDAAICNINATLENIDCADIFVTGAYPCIGISGLTPVNLCAVIGDINTAFCSLGISHPFSSSTGIVSMNSFPDGGNGTFTGANTLTNMIGSANVGLTADGSIAHGPSANSLRATSTSTAIGTVSGTTPINVKAGYVYAIRSFAYTTSGSYPVGSTITVIINGSGTQIPLRAVTLSSGNVGKWINFNTEYIPDVDQTITVSLQVSNFTNGTYINFADLVVEVLTTKNGGNNSEFYIMQQTSSSALYGSFGTSFVVSGGTFTPTGLVLGMVQSVYNINGNIVYAISQNVTMSANSDNYLYFDRWTSSYTVKSVAISAPQPNTDDSAIILWKVTTNGSAVTSSTDLRVTTPFVGTSIAPGTITGTQIASNTISDSNLTVSGVTAGAYIGSITVNTQGRVTSATNLFTITSPLQNAHFYYDTGTSQWKNAQTFTIDSGTTTLSIGNTVNSPNFTLRGYYSPAGSPLSYDAVITHNVTTTGPASSINMTIGGAQVFNVSNKGNFSVLNTLNAPGSPLTGGYFEYAAPVTINAVTKSAPHFLDEFGNIIILTTTNTYTQTYAGLATTLNAYTSNGQGSAYTGIDSGVGGTPYAQVTDLNTLRVAYETLRTSYDNLISVFNQVVTDLKTIGIFH